jgi:hypothetical protein
VQETEAAKERVSSLLEKLKRNNKSEWELRAGRTDLP